LILVAECRKGKRCRYHGRIVESPAVESALCVIQNVTVCPEMAAGFGCPREPIYQKHGRYLAGGRDVTKLLKATCKKLAARFKHVDYYVGVKNSPTCDPKTGLFAIALLRHGVGTRLNVGKPRVK
jgi:uncharacterized protein YbbK (DUF523 family)